MDAAAAAAAAAADEDCCWRAWPWARPEKEQTERKKRRRRRSRRRRSHHMGYSQSLEKRLDQSRATDCLHSVITTNLLWTGWYHGITENVRM
jgi:hypothetical protein